MDVFLTGATGYIGQAVAAELAQARHQVTALVRRHGEAGDGGGEAGERLRGLGVRTVVGDIGDPETYRDQAARHQVVVHMAFDAQGAPGADAKAVETLVTASQASQVQGLRSLVYTSGVWVLGATGDQAASEETPTDHPLELVAWRVGHEARVLGAAGKDLATAVIRPGIVYGGSGGIPGSYFDSAEKEGAARFVGDGSNRLPMIHVQDLARFYRLVVERSARGVFHAVDGNAVPLAEVARSASEAAGAGGATRSVPLEQARQGLGGFADALALDQVVETRRAGEIGWRPERTSFPAEASRAYHEWKSACS